MSAKTLPFPDAIRQDSYAVYPEDLIIIGLDTDDGPEHPHYDVRIKHALDEKKLAATRTYGVTDQIKTQKLPDGRVIVLSGNHRVMYARAVNKERKAAGEELIRVPVSAPLDSRGGYDQGRSMGIRVMSNELATADELPAKIAKARRLNAEPYNRTPQELAVMFGRNVATIYSWLKLSDATPKVLEAMEARVLTPSAASKLASMPSEEQDAALEKLQAEAPKDKAGNAKKISNAAVAQNKRAQKDGGEGDNAINGTAYGKRVWTALVEHEKADTLPPDFIKGIRFCLNQKVRVAGLTALLDEVTAPKPGKVLYSGDE